MYFAVGLLKSFKFRRVEGARSALAMLPMPVCRHTRSGRISSYAVSGSRRHSVSLCKQHNQVTARASAHISAAKKMLQEAILTEASYKQVGTAYLYFMGSLGHFCQTHDHLKVCSIRVE